MGPDIDPDLIDPDLNRPLPLSPPQGKGRMGNLPIFRSRQLIAPSGDDVRDDVILDLDDLILQRQLLLFQAAQGQRIGAA